MPHYTLEIKLYFVKQLDNSNVVKVPQLIGKRTEEPIFSRFSGTPDPQLNPKLLPLNQMSRRKLRFFSPIYYDLPEKVLENAVIFLVLNVCHIFHIDWKVLTSSA